MMTTVAIYQKLEKKHGKTLALAGKKIIYEQMFYLPRR